MGTVFGACQKDDVVDHPGSSAPEGELDSKGLKKKTADTVETKKRTVESKEAAEDGPSSEASNLEQANSSNQNDDNTAIGTDDTNLHQRRSPPRTPLAVTVDKTVSNEERPPSPSTPLTPGGSKIQVPAVLQTPGGSTATAVESLDPEVLASLPPEQLRSVIGESLYPLVCSDLRQQENPSNGSSSGSASAAAPNELESKCRRVTGMLLQTDDVNKVLLHLSNHRRRKSSVREALQILATAEGDEPLTAENLAQFDSDRQKNIIGERLYALIREEQPELAGKITGMMLKDFDNDELLKLLERHSKPELSQYISQARDSLSSKQ